MKITKARLKQIIKEELDKDAKLHISDYFERMRLKPATSPGRQMQATRHQSRAKRHGGSYMSAEVELDILANQLVNFFGYDIQDAKDLIDSEFRKIMTGTIREYSPYQKGARPDKPHKKPGETKDDGKYADPKRARPKRMNEELTRQDKTDVKKMVKDELEKLLKKKEMKDQISELTKKILKKLYKDLSLEHPYIIDRIKV